VHAWHKFLSCLLLQFYSYLPLMKPVVCCL
jgi:hypothetical protein